MTDTEALVTVDVADGVATVAFNRPHRRNALIPPMCDQLAAELASIGDRDDVGAVVFAGSGGAFCSGLDLGEYNADPAPEWLPTAGHSLRDAHVALASCPVPVVVALERYAINGGAAFALAGDLVVAGTDAWLQVGEIHLGMPAPNNLAWLAARHPLSTIMRLVLIGDRVGAHELHRLGIATEVVPDDAVLDRAHELAVAIAAAPNGAGRRIKQAALAISGERPDPADAGAWFERARALSGAVPLPPVDGMRTTT